MLRIQELIPQKCLNDKKRNAVKTCFPPFLLQQSKINDIKIEKDLLKPFLKGRDVRKWKISWRGMHLLFPHMQENSTIIAIPESELRTKYPQTFNYLETSKEKLNSRKWFGKTATDIYGEWYALMYSVNPAMFEQPKLVTPAISDKNNFTYDLDGYYFSVGGGTIYGISLVGDIWSERNYYYLLGILNSNAVEFYFKHISSVLSGGYYEYHSQYLERLPIHLPKTKSEQDLADKITNKVELILKQVKLETQIENFPDEYLQEYRSKGNEFDSINITFKSGLKALEPVIEEDTTGRGNNIVLGKKEKPVFVDSATKANHVVTALKGTRAKKDEKKQIFIPKSNAIVEEILNKLEENKVNTKSPSVAELKDEINGLVYTLYGLNEKDVEVIEDFLGRF